MHKATSSTDARRTPCCGTRSSYRRIVADRTRRARRGRRPGSGALSVAQAEAELPDDVRRRLRVGSRVAQGWVPDPPEATPGDTTHRDSSRELTEDAAAAAADADVSRDQVPSSTGAWLRGALRERVPPGLRGAVVVPSGRAVAGLAALLAAALAIVLVLTWLQRPSESSLPAVRRSTPAGAVVSLPPSPTASPEVVVHVTGAVRRPGLVELPGGSRVEDAVVAAGGATRKADLGSVNLARLLLDGEQILVLQKGHGPAQGAHGPSTDGTSPPGQPVDLNTATLEQLDALPGVGPVLARRIIDWRTAHGRFSSVDQLTDVSGIGERTLADLRALVRT